MSQAHDEPCGFGLEATDSPGVVPPTNMTPPSFEDEHASQEELLEESADLNGMKKLLDGLEKAVRQTTRGITHGATTLSMENERLQTENSALQSQLEHTFARLSEYEESAKDTNGKLIKAEK